MREFILLMFNDARDNTITGDGRRWEDYFSGLRASGRFDGGSSIGSGVRLRKGSDDRSAQLELDGFIRVRAVDIDDARRFLVGNPVYEGGGTVEIRELPVDG
jgi:hypothetical protein